MLGSVAMERQRICVCELDGWEVCKGLAEQVKLNSDWRCALLCLSDWLVNGVSCIVIGWQVVTWQFVDPNICARVCGCMQM